MCRGKPLSLVDQAVVKALNRAGKSRNEICKQTKLSKYIVKTYLKNPERYGKRDYPGRPPTMTAAATRNLILTAKKCKRGSRWLKVDLNLPISDRHIRRLLANSGKLKYLKRKSSPYLTAPYKIKRKAFAIEWSQRILDIMRVIFSDEKRFNLDGPDGLQYYWHTIGTDVETCWSRQNGGGGLMVWAAFSKKGKTKLVFIKGNINAASYIKTLTDELLEYIALHGDQRDEQFIFQQDNARPHTAKATTAFLADQYLPCMDWPSRSPDLNPMENLWGIMVQAVYGGGRQYKKVDALKEALLAAWDAIPQATLDKLIDSMNSRFLQCIEREGGKTKY